MIIKNRGEICSHGNKKGRHIAVEVIEYALNAVNAYDAVKDKVWVEKGRVNIGDLYYDLSEIKNVYVIGGGKATFPIAHALDELFGDKITEGVIIVKEGEKRRLNNIKVIEAGHPLPNEQGLEGVKEIVDIAQEAREDDLVFCAITGGASALMPYPVEGISLEDKKAVTDLLLKCGASIEDINTVRKHISAIKGGRLAQTIHPAKIVNLVVIDEVAGLPWGPTIPDRTTFKDTINILKKYHLWHSIPLSVRDHIRKGLKDSNLETPKPKDFKDLWVHTIVLSDNRIMCKAAKKRAEELGYNSLILSTMLEGESREIGIILASIAKEEAIQGRPLKPPCIFICGGETTVTILGEHGLGGPSQELVLGAALKIAGHEKIVIASIDTDGTDGPTEIAGGIVDGCTVERTQGKIDIFQHLIRHNSSEVLLTLQDALLTNPTETNVMDLNLIVITR